MILFQKIYTDETYYEVEFDITGYPSAPLTEIMDTLRDNKTGASVGKFKVTVEYLKD